jgi:hypothetical protein
MSFERNRLFDDPDTYFDMHGSALMKMTATAAQAVCNMAAQYGLIVVRIKGGIWHNLGFEARTDFIWDGDDPPIEISIAEINNKSASDFVKNEQLQHDAFIITTAPISEYPHKTS